MPRQESHSLWYKDAVIYELHVKAFQDSNGDGRGDFRGLVERLDYVQDLGATAIWLLPFYPSPQRDDGYDISDYRDVHADYGTLGDFRFFVREAHRRGLKVITELVINHTSDQHPWFQAARRAKPGSARREFYVWSDNDQKFKDTRIIFTDTEKSNWAWDPEAGAYYWHRFFSHQPDLNLNNPRVVRAVGRVLRFWLDMGVDGLRLDAVPYLCVREGTSNENLPETHAVIRELRRLVDEHYEERMLLAEANQWPDDVRPYFADGDECHMAFHFPLMPRIFMALRQEDRRPVTEILERTPQIPDVCQWALFLRNHDELTLEMVTNEERDYMYREYARDPRMRVNLGIRRRLAPLLENSRRRIELLNSLLLSFPGTPVIYYGDEIGMGDNVWLGDRDGVRTPMQWSSDRNGGFSRVDPARLYLPALMDPVYGYQALNVEAHLRSPASLLHFMRRLIALRRQHKAFGRGTLRFLRPRNRKVLAYVRRWRGETILCVANLSRYAQPCELDLSDFRGRTPLEMIGRTEFPPIGELPYFLTLGPHAFYWFRLERQAEPLRLASGARVDPGTLPVVRIDQPDELFGPDYRFTLGNDLLGPWIVRQRWFQGKAREAASSSVADAVKIGARLWIVFLDVGYADGSRDTYVVPLEIASGDPATQAMERAPSSVVARLQIDQEPGVLFDALADRAACATMLAAIRDGRRLRTAEGGILRATPTTAFERAERSAEEDAEVRLLGAEQSNTSVIFDNAWILKLFRRVEDGPNPDLEIGRMLTERSRFGQVPAVAGALEYERAGRQAAAVGMLQAFVPSEGDGWSYFLGLLRSYYGRVAGLRPAGDELPPAGLPLVARSRISPPAALAARLAPSLDAARVLGRTTARFHRALAEERRDPSFAPVPIDRSWLEGRADEMARQAGQVLELLDARARTFSGSSAAAVHEVLSTGRDLLRRFKELAHLETGGARIRIHGDYHLGQVLRVKDDFVLIDFEGEPLRSLTERRSKDCALVDVAGMLRSFDYASRAAMPREDGGSAQGDAVDEAWVRVWETWVGSSFLGAWLAETEGAPFRPREDALDALLDLLVVHKAFYELRYELENRPDWVGIPLGGILSIVARGA